MVRNLRETLEAVKFREWEMPVNQMNGIHIDAPQLVTSLSFETVKDYDDYIARLRQVPRAFREVTVQMRKGMGEGLMPPKILLVQVAKQANDLATQKPEDSPFAIPTTKFPKEFSAADQQRLRDGVLAALRDSVLPAYGRFTAFVRDEYAPHGRTEIGTWSLPNGEERYAFAVRRSTTTNMTPDEIHALGLREVARIEADQLVIAKRLGFPTVRALRDSIPKIPALHPKSREQILDEYRHYVDQMSAKLPTLFGKIAESQARGDADRAVPREGSLDFLQSGNARWLSSRPRVRQHLRLRESADDQQRVDCVPRRNSRPPHADFDRAGAS